MIALLRGVMLHRDGNACVIDVRGVGYAVLAPVGCLDDWSDEDEVTVHVSTQVREDAITLFGFSHTDQRAAFNVLLGVSGVGPKLALSALDALGIDGLRTAVDADDVRTLTKVPGVGKRTAQRLALELKGKLPASTVVPMSGRTAVPGSPADQLPLALARLGYKKSEIDKAQSALVEQGITPDQPVAERLRAALKILSGAR